MIVLNMKMLTGIEFCGHQNYLLLSVIISCPMTKRVNITNVVLMLKKTLG